MATMFRGISKVCVLVALIIFLQGTITVDREMLKMSNLSRESTVENSKEDVIPSAFDKMLDVAYSRISNQTSSQLRGPRNPLVLDQNWQKSNGGLTDADRVHLGQIYQAANSVFEYGLGESTYIANAVNVPVYAGIDSDPVWVAQAREKVAKHFRFYLADIGETIAWGYPKHGNLAKSTLHYQLAPLMVEPQAFDVYMVDGRWRFGCLMASFLHASARGGQGTTVLVHDCERSYYHRADHLLNVTIAENEKLCVYHRKPTTTDEELYDLWMKHYTDVN